MPALDDVDLEPGALERLDRRLEADQVVLDEHDGAAGIEVRGRLGASAGLLGRRLRLLPQPLGRPRGRRVHLVGLLACGRQLVGHLLLALLDLRGALGGLLLMESCSLGCRYHLTSRFEADRDVVEVATRFGTVRVKRAWLAGRPLAAALSGRLTCSCVKSWPSAFVSPHGYEAISS